MLGRPKRTCLPLLFGLLAFCALTTTSCDHKKEPLPSPLASSLPRAPSEVRVTPLTSEFLTRGTLALTEKLGAEVRVLEVRARGTTLSLQLESEGRFQQIDYVELAQPSSTLPLAKIVGPDPIETVGEGNVESNLFSFSEVDLAGIAKSFPVAKKAVDPLDGEVIQIIVRRFFPFSDKLRARIYVDSPKMSGSIDTNERGIPLRKR